MESESSRRKKKKSVAFQPKQELSVRMLHTNLYRAASRGHHNELNEILENLNSRLSQDDLENIIMNIYTELKLNNIALTDDVEVQLYEYLWKRCFFSKQSTDFYKISDIKNHVKTLTCIVDCVRYFSDEEEKLIFSLKFAIKEIHFLKHFLRSTYDVLPWEEIEFYLLCFIISTTERHDLNVIFKTTLNKSDLVNHLNDFVESLVKLHIEDKNELSKLPELRRNEAVRRITKNCPNFKNLYKNIDFIRDVYSLYKIRKFAKLSQSTGPQEFRSAEMIVRVLSVISEQLKYTLDSPKLSPIKGNLIISTLTESSRRAILELRNAVGCEEAIVSKWKLIGDSNEKFLKTILDDLKQVAQVAEYLLFRHIFRLLKQRFQKIEEYPDVLEEMETFFSIVDIVSNTSISNYKPLQDKMNEILQNLPAEMKAEILPNLEKIITTKPTPKNFEGEKILTYILKPEAHRDVFLNYVNSGLSGDDIRDLLDIVLSIQKKLKNSSMDEIGILISEMINVLMLEIDNVEDWTETFEETIKINYHEGNNGESSRKKKEINYEHLMTERKSTLGKIMHNNNKSQLTFAKLKNDHKSLEIMKSLVLDIIICISNVETDKEAKKYSQNHSMLVDWLKSDYELNDLVFNSTITVFHIANSFIKDTPVHSMNPNNNKLTKSKSSFSDQFVEISKKLKIFHNLAEGDFEHFEKFMQMEADIRTRDAKKSTYLHIAAEKSDTSQIDYLCNEGLSVYCKNISNETPLHIAAKKGNEQVVSYFIQKAKDVVNNVDDLGRTALHLAVLNKRLQIVERLLDAGSDPFKKDSLGFTSPVYAVFDGNKEMLSLLLRGEENIPAQQSELETLLNIAIAQNSSGIVEFLWSEKYVTLDDQIRDTAMSSAVSNGQVEIVNTLLSHGARPTENSILIAVQKNFDLIVENLLRYKADAANAVNRENRMTPLHYAARNGNDFIVDMLMQHKANMDFDKAGNTPLHIAVANRHVNIVKKLLEYEKGSRIINALNSKRYTALHIAAEIGEFDIAALLVERWAHLDNDNYSVTPLQLAKSNGYEKIVNLLVNNGATYTKTPAPSPSPIGIIPRVEKNLSLPKETIKTYKGLSRPSESPIGIPLTTRILDNPTIIVRYLDEDDGKCSYNEIINKIIEQNGFERKVKYNVEILRKYKKSDKYNIIMVLQKSIYNEIMGREELNIGWNSCPVSDYFYIFRCYKCAGFGHNETDCENEQVCRRCSGAHSKNECTNKQFKCLHCAETNETMRLNLDIAHSPLDQFCPCYRKLLKNKYEKQKKTSRSSHF